MEAAGDVDVMVFCGVAKLMKGMGGNPHDMDLLVKKGEMERLDSRLVRYQLEPPRLSDNEFFSGVLARYRVCGVDVDISGGITAKGDGCDFVLEPDKVLCSRAKKFCAKPLFIPLEEQLIFDFVRRDKPEKVEALLKHFERHKPDLGFLKERMEFHGIPEDLKARLLSAVGGA